jgi:hypothetical protein
MRLADKPQFHSMWKAQKRLARWKRGVFLQRHFSGSGSPHGAVALDELSLRHFPLLKVLLEFVQ